MPEIQVTQTIMRNPILEAKKAIVFLKNILPRLGDIHLRIFQQEVNVILVNLIDIPLVIIIHLMMVDIGLEADTVQYLKDIHHFQNDIHQIQIDTLKIDTLELDTLERDIL